MVHPSPNLFSKDEGTDPPKPQENEEYERHMNKKVRYVSVSEQCTKHSLKANAPLYSVLVHVVSAVRPRPNPAHRRGTNGRSRLRPKARDPVRRHQGSVPRHRGAARRGAGCHQPHGDTWGLLGRVGGGGRCSASDSCACAVLCRHLDVVPEFGWKAGGGRNLV